LKTKILVSPSYIIIIIIIIIISISIITIIIIIINVYTTVFGLCESRNGLAMEVNLYCSLTYNVGCVAWVKQRKNTHI
jgi:hypothetical protein